MFTKRTDLAMEARELWQESAEKTTRLAGVRASQSSVEGYTVTQVDILDSRGAEALGKPVGTYRTIDLTPFRRRGSGFFETAVSAAGGELRELLPEQGTALVVGLGNRSMTPDAVGPLALEHVLVTRHLLSDPTVPPVPLRSVAALGPGVLGNTGVESAEAVRAVAARVRPSVVLVIDALASRGLERLCNTIQLSDSGIVPGSGVGNHRQALNRQTLGVPVIAIGVPTVVDAATLAADLLEASGGETVPEEALRSHGQSVMVTPQDIDRQVRDLAKLVGYAINWALQDLDLEDITALLS